MKILFVRSRDNIVFSHKIISYDIESCDLFDVCNFDEVRSISKMYDWVFLLHDRERVEWVQEVRKYIKVACWSLEDPYELDQDLEICRKYDFVFSIDSSAVDIRRKLGKFNTYHLPLATNTAIYYPDTVGKEYESDILLVGVAFPLRIKVLNELSDFIQDNNYKLKIIGWWWEKLNNKYLERNCVERGLFPPEIIQKWYNGSKIVLEINRDLYNTNLKVTARTPGRGFNSLACKKFTISDFRLDTEKLFDIDKELKIFLSYNDLKDKIKYYMEAISDREVVETQGYKRVLKEHTIINRLNKIENILENIGWMKDTLNI